MVLGKKDGRFQAYTFSPSKTASDESGGSDKIRAYLDGYAAAATKLRDDVEAAFSTEKPVQPTGPGGLVEKVENEVSGDLVPDAPNQDGVTGVPAVKSASKECIETRIKDMLQHSPRAQRAKSLSDMIKQVRFDKGRSSE
jgi:hypothetical protein